MAEAMMARRRGRPGGLRPAPLRSSAALISGVNCRHAEPVVALAVGVVDAAIRTLLGYWQDGQPVEVQPEEAQDALAFLTEGVAGTANPFFWHEMAGVEVIEQMQPGELLRRLLANR